MVVYQEDIPNSLILVDILIMFLLDCAMLLDIGQSKKLNRSIKHHPAKKFSVKKIFCFSIIFSSLPNATKKN